MSTEIIAAVSLLTAVVAILLTCWQNFLQRRAMQAQVFLHMLDQSVDQGVADGLRLLGTLPSYATYAEYEGAQPPEARDKIYRLVDFLNTTANLVEDGYLPRQEVWNLYFMAYRVADAKLLTWWLERIRTEGYRQKFSSFERMCIAVGNVSDEAILRFERKHNRVVAKRRVPVPA